jgi:hypothetical protein
MIVATDATPAFLARHWKPRQADREAHTHNERFRRLVPRVSAWLPMSATVAQSLIEDYGADPARCFVTRAPQPLIDPQSHSPTGDILFVAMISSARAASICWGCSSAGFFPMFA